LFELSLSSVREYLRRRGVAGCQTARVTELGGGVSNTVLLVETGDARLVIKQALARLHVPEEWLSDPRRALRECAAIEALAPHLPEDAVPRIVFVDEENFLYAMEAAPAEALPWKSLLLEGSVSADVAARVALMLAATIRATWRDSWWREAFGDTTIFDELRLEPYYRFTASRHPDFAPRFQALVEDCHLRACSIVHGDWSPKNFLVAGGRVTAIDYEVTHFGNPAFDSAFLLNHLLLKCHFLPQWKNDYARAALCFWETLTSALPDGAEWMEQATLAHLGGLHLARIDGKSPAEYVRDPVLKDHIRRFARRLLADPPASIARVFE